MHAVAARVLDQLRRLVETHRLRVQQRAGECGGMEAFEPRRGPGEDREARRVRFGKAVFAEALDLLEDAFEIRFVVAAFEHAAADVVAERFEIATTPPGGHRTTQLVGTSCAETCDDLDQLHDLFLEDRHAERAFEHYLDGGISLARFALEARLRIDDGLVSFAPTQIRMNHVALDRAGPHDRDLHDEIVEIARLQARQHRHLCARFDLEHADRVRLADHVEDRLARCVVFIAGRRNVVQARLVAVGGQRPQGVRVQQVEALADAGEHAEREHVDLEQAHLFEVVLVPLDDRALGHRGIFDRHEFVQRRFRDDEAADVLREMARETAQLGGKREQMPQRAAGRIETAFAQARFERLAAADTREQAGQHVELVVGNAERAADVAHGALAAVADHGRGERGAFAAVLAEHVLDDFFAAFVFEVDVDVGRFVALLRQEAFEQQVAVFRRDRGDAEAVADRGIRGRTAALAEDRR
jgi:hypothetical protein